MKPWLIRALIVAVLGAGAGWYWLESRPAELPAGFVKSNGRIEAERIDISSRFSGRLREIRVAEGELVTAGQVIARIDSTQVEAELRVAEADVRQAEQSLLEAQALNAQRKAELVFAEQELARALSLNERGHASGETVDRRRAQQATARAAVLSAQAGIARAQASIDATQAAVDRLHADLAEYVLKAPKAGRVQYRLVEPGEVVAAGGRIVSLLDLADVSMTVYLPTGPAGQLRYGAEARLIFDAAPRYVVPAKVTFVAAEAQFTPRYVETESEREKLTFRVEVKIPRDILIAHRDVVKTGVPGMAYIRVDPSAAWPDALAIHLPNDR
ncbi:MAG: HlyD family efflux transporter periplasmic adaptor subunit [Alphaproteobacteria bacterium]